MKKLPSIALVLFALAVAIPGVLGLLAPRALGTPLYGPTFSVDSLNEMRAVGGTRLGLACVLLFAAWSPEWRRPGLVLGCVAFGFTLLGRLLSTALDGAPGSMVKPEIAEGVLILVALVALRMMRGSDESRVGVGETAASAPR